MFLFMAYLDPLGKKVLSELKVLILTGMSRLSHLINDFQLQLKVFTLFVFVFLALLSQT